MTSKIGKETLKRKTGMQVTAYPIGLNHSITGELRIAENEFRVYAGNNYHTLVDGEKIEIPSTDGRKIINQYEVRL